MKLYAYFTRPVTAKIVYKFKSANCFILRHELLNELTPLTFAEYSAIITYKD